MTMTPTTPAIRKTGTCRSWIFWASGPLGWNVSSGASLAQPATARPSPATASGAHRRQGQRRRASIHIRHHGHRTPGPLLLGHHGTTTFPSITPRSSPVCVRNEKMPGFGIVTVRIDALPPPM